MLDCYCGGGRGVCHFRSSDTNKKSRRRGEFRMINLVKVFFKEYVNYVSSNSYLQPDDYY